MSVFLDTSTLLYPLDRRDPEKRLAAKTWLIQLRDSDRLVLSPQVLNEAYSIVARKPGFAEARPIVRDYLTALMQWATAPLGSDTLAQAWSMQDRFGVQFWDGLLLASATLARCRYFLSEDLNHGQNYGSVVVLNPFHAASHDVVSVSE